MGLITIVSSHHERSVARVGDAFIKFETDSDHIAREVHALRSVTAVPVPQVLWTHDGPPLMLALSAIPGAELARLGQRSAFGSEAWIAAGQMLRDLHTAQEPPATSADTFPPEHLVDVERWLHDNGHGDRALVTDLVDRASAVLAAHTPANAFLHGDMQAAHVFIGDHDEVTGVIDWADSGYGDPHVDVAVLTVGHREFLRAVLDGYGDDLDHDVITAYQIVRRLTSVRWMIEHGFDASDDIAALGTHSSPE